MKSSLTRCLQEAGDFLNPDTKAAIIKRAGELRGEGKTPADAARQAVQDQLMQAQAGRKEVETAFNEGLTLYETPPPKSEGAKAEAEAAVSRVDQVARDMPDMLVQMDGMEPMKVGDFLAAVRAEADEMAADAPLMQVAAECFLLHP